MQLTGNITPESLMTLEAYTKYRKTHKAAVMEHRKLRSVRLGENINLQFESETTIRYQIQEMLRIEKIFEEEGILHRFSLTLQSASQHTSQYHLLALLPRIVVQMF